MSLKSKMHLITSELKTINESEERIKMYASELNELNPLKVGDEYIVTGYSHHGKTIVAEKIFVSDRSRNNVEFSAKEPVYFMAIGRVKKKNGELGSYSGEHKIFIDVLMEGE